MPWTACTAAALAMRPALQPGAAKRAGDQPFRYEHA
jgi:hypothetical protein